MANGYLAAASASMRALSGGKRGATVPIDPAAVGWEHAVAAVALLAVVVVASVMAPAGELVMQFLPMLLEILFVTFATLAVPFLVLGVAATWSRQREKLPLLVMFTALSLILIQVTSLVLSLFGLSTSTALIGVTAYFVGRASRTVLGFSLGNSILVALLVAAGIFAASFLLLAMPSGHALLGAA